MKENKLAELSKVYIYSGNVGRILPNCQGEYELTIAKPTLVRVSVFVYPIRRLAYHHAIACISSPPHFAR